MTAIEYWNNRVENHHAQSIKAQEEMQSQKPSTWSQGDFWKSFVSNFKDDPHRTGDILVDRLAQEVDSTKTVMDVGGGAGRLALPLALHSSHVTVVEPSESMVAALRESASEAGIENVSVTEETWEEAKVEPADVILCAHVVYGVTNIETFVNKLNAHAREKILLLAYTSAPISRFSAFWKPVHGDDRVTLPGMPEIVSVLWDMGIYPDVEMLDGRQIRPFEDREQALEQLRTRIYVTQDSEKDSRLKAAMEDLLIETDSGLVIKGSPLSRLGLVSWRPE